MIFRHSIRSVFRTPVKTVLFILLIAAVTAFLYLGINTWVASTAMLRDCESNYTTIVTMEYPEDYGSREGDKSEAMLSDLSDIDFDAIAENENVIRWQPSDVGMGSIQGFVSNDKDPEYSYYCVFIVKGLRQYAEGSPFYGKLMEDLYSFRPYEAGHSIFIENSVDDFGFVPDPDATYVIHAQNYRLNANGLTVRLSPFYSAIAQRAGVDCDSIKPIMEIESAEALLADENNVYKTIAKYYAAINNTLMIHRAHDLGEIKEFHQNYLQPVSGRLFTKQEAEDGAKVCIISQALADDLDLNTGDTLTIHLPDDEDAAVYSWGDKMSREETLTIIGIVNYHADYYRNVYTTPNSGSARPIRYLYDLGQATIKNGTVDTFLARMKELLPERVFISVYDQGYQATVDSLRVIQSAAAALSIIAFAVTLAVLAFFAYLFSDLHLNTVGIMRSFGAKKTEVRLYLMIGASLIALVAIATGILTGIRYGETLIGYAYGFISDLQITDMRYSDGFRGIVKGFTPIMGLSYTLAGSIGFGTLFTLLMFCFYFAERAISGRLIAVKERVRVRRSPRKSSVSLSGPLRHAVLSIRRGRARSLLVPALGMAVLLFVSSLQAALASYDTAREDLYNNTTLTGYCAQKNGKFSDRLYIENRTARKFINLDNLNDITYTYTFNYVYLGISVHGDGTPGHPKDVPEPTNPFKYQILSDILSSEPNIVFTDTVEGAPEFYFDEFHADFMPGWDRTRFSDRQWERLPCIVSSSFMREQKIELGDTIRVYTRNYIFDSPFFGLDMVVVGNFNRVANQNNIYCPLPLGALEPDRDVYAGYNFRDPENNDTITQQQLIEIMLSNKYVSSLTFKINEPRFLGEIKDDLEEARFSSPKTSNDIRTWVVIEDAQFNETLSSIAQRSRYLEILYPVLLALVGILGLIMGFLAINNRREDIALMRSMGLQKCRIFATIFGEQLLLLLFGALLGAIIWYVREGAAQLATPRIYIFFICYALSAAISVFIQNAKSALSILAEKE